LGLKVVQGDASAGVEAGFAEDQIAFPQVCFYFLWVIHATTYRRASVGKVRGRLYSGIELLPRGDAAD
jgi:hypothetical protein